MAGGRPGHFINKFLRWQVMMTRTALSLTLERSIGELSMCKRLSRSKRPPTQTSLHATSTLMMTLPSEAVAADLLGSALARS